MEEKSEICFSNLLYRLYILNAIINELITIFEAIEAWVTFIRGRNELERSVGGGVSKGARPRRRPVSRPTIDHSVR